MDDIYKSVIEAIIFSSDEPIPESEIIKAIKAIDGDETEMSQEDVQKAVDELNLFYVANGSAVNIVKIEDIMQDEDFIEQKKRIMMNLMEENLEKEIKDESENAD